MRPEAALCYVPECFLAIRLESRARPGFAIWPQEYLGDGRWDIFVAWFGETGKRHAWNKKGAIFCNEHSWALFYDWQQIAQEEVDTATMTYRLEDQEVLNELAIFLAEHPEVLQGWRGSEDTPGYAMDGPGVSEIW